MLLIQGIKVKTLLLSGNPVVLILASLQIILRIVQRPQTQTVHAARASCASTTCVQSVRKTNVSAGRNQRGQVRADRLQFKEISCGFKTEYLLAPMPVYLWVSCQGT